MNILNYQFKGENIGKIPDKLTELISNSKPFWLKNLIGSDGEVKLIKNQNAYILCIEKNYYKEIEIIIMNINDNKLHLTAITRSPPATLVNTLIQDDYSPELWLEKQFTYLKDHLSIKFERIM